MTRLLMVLGMIAVATSPAFAGGKKSIHKHAACKGSFHSAACSSRKLSPFYLSHPRKSRAVIKQLYISKGFGR